MEAEKVNQFLLFSAKYFPEYQIPFIREALLKLDEDQFNRVQFLQFKDPTVALLISIFAGTLGIDRFYLGHTALGIIKLLTCGGFGFWTLVDWFIIMSAAKDENAEKLFGMLRGI
ncbi:TM2 domain-containing protein [Porphyromonas sp.]|uniref:TM2 domain-containing protein n=1 Tax=Porphyromonas sp. TaxID=1924944 RepID=UPI0026DAA43C|nr:TM2 domain-containing protein [Porphyromonas sp.]MDO4771322.1 TM2 domain-containing protein [Porphyromonas sp.]